MQEPIGAYLACRKVACMEGYRGIWDHPRFPLFLSFVLARRDEPASFQLSYKSLWRIVQAAGIQAGIAGVHPHQLRHSFAHALLNSTHDIRLVAQALGHRNLSTTLRYTERRPEDLAEAIEGIRKK